MSASLRVLHVQTDTGLTGGVAHYIAALMRDADGVHGQDWVTVAPDLTGSVAVQASYAGASLLPMPPTYRPWRLGAYIEQLARHVRAHQIDVIHAHAARAGFAAAEVSRRTGCPLVYTNHGLRFTQKGFWPASHLFEWAERRACGAASAVVCVRPFDEAVLRDRQWIDPAKLHTIRTRLDAPVVERSPLALAPPVLIGCGSLIDVKRPDRFLRWLGALSAVGVAFEAHWLGDGPLLPRMQSMAAAMGVHVHWHGHQGRHAVTALMQRATLLLLTSDFEVFPLSVVEGYACGLPVVGTRFSGVHDIVQDGVTGMLVDGDDPVQSAARIANLLRDAVVLDGMSRHARSFFVENHAGVALMRSAYAGLYRQSLKEARLCR